MLEIVSGFLQMEKEAEAKFAVPHLRDPVTGLVDKRCIKRTKTLSSSVFL